jgi:Flp pilus assembly pilin Flp
MRDFLQDEAGSVSVEMTLWMAFLVAASTAFGQQVLGTMIEQAQRQAALNEASLELIRQASSVCAIEVSQ